VLEERRVVADRVREDERPDVPWVGVRVRVSARVGVRVRASARVGVRVRVRARVRVRVRARVGVRVRVSAWRHAPLRRPACSRRLHLPGRQCNLVAELALGPG